MTLTKCMEYLSKQICSRVNRNFSKLYEISRRNILHLKYLLNLN